MEKETFEKLKRWGLIRKGFSWDRYQKMKSDNAEKNRKLKEKIANMQAKRKQKLPEELRKMGKMFAACFFLSFIIGLIFPPFLIIAFLCLIGLLVTAAMKYLEG